MTETPTTGARSIEQRKQEKGKLKERKIQAQTQLKSAEEQLKSLEKEAEDEFGTSDIDELAEKLERMEAENEKQRREYQTLLDKISQDLRAVEQAGKNDAEADSP